MGSFGEQQNFLRVLGRRDALALAFGAMIGWSWVVLSGVWIESAGAIGAITAFLIGGGIMLVIGLTYAELASALPFAGGEHVYSHRAMGAGCSFICTWAVILGYVSVVTFEAVALPTVLDALLPGLDKIFLWQIAGWDVYLSWVLVGVAGAVTMTILNVRGVRMAAVVQSAVVIVILLVGGLFVLGSLANGDTANMEPLFVDGLSGITLVLVMVPFMFVGFDTIPQAAEEIDLPYREIGSVLMLSVAMAVAWYVLMVLGVSLVLNKEAFATSEIIVAEANSVVFGEAGRLTMLGAGLAGILTSWNAFIIGGSRAIYALARAKPITCSSWQVTSKISHSLQCDLTDRCPVNHWAFFSVDRYWFATGTGLVGKCRRSGYCCCLCHGCAVFPDFAFQRARSRATL